MTRLPAIVEPQAKRFKKIFRNKSQCQHFKQYVTGLMLCGNKTVMGIQSKYLNSGSTNSLDHFMIRSEWSATELNDKRIADLQQRTATASKLNGFICIDDTLTHKTGKHMDDAELHFDLSTRKFILGHNIVSIQNKDRNISYPIDFRQYYRKPTEQELKKQYRKLEKQADLFEPIQYFIVKLKLLLDYQRRL